MENHEQNHLTKYIKEFKRKASAEDSNLKRVKGELLNSAITLLKGREMVFKAFENGIFLKPQQSKQSEQSDQSDQSSNDDKYTSLKLDKDLYT